MALLNNILILLLDASFWLVIGLCIGGVFKTLIPTDFLHKHLSTNNFSSIIKAAILGAPLPLCSCGVIPAAMGLRQAGASKPATTSFLVSTPETGVDSVFITYAMMGPFMAVTRPIVAIVSAITTGMLVNTFDKSDEPGEQPSHQAVSCCDSEKQTTLNKKKTDTTSETTCCSSKSHGHESVVKPVNKEHKKNSIFSKMIDGVVYAFTDLLDNIILWLAIGILFAALVQTYVPSDLLIQYGTGITGMLVMLVVGIPMYVCATASTPLAAGFLMAGISPGAVLVFLMAGPATNMATLGIINKHMGKKTMCLYLLGIMFIALLSGFLLNWIVELWAVDFSQYLQMNHSHIPLWLQLLALILLTVVSLRHIINALIGRFIPQQQ